MICTHNATLTVAPKNEFNHVEYSVGANADLSPEQKQLSPCYENNTSGPYFDKLHIVSANKAAAASSPGASIMNIIFSPANITNTALYEVSENDLVPEGKKWARKKFGGEVERTEGTNWVPTDRVRSIFL